MCDLGSEAMVAWRSRLPRELLAHLPPAPPATTAELIAGQRLGRMLAQPRAVAGVVRVLQQPSRHTAAFTALQRTLLGLDVTRRLRLVCWAAARDRVVLAGTAVHTPAAFPPDLLMPTLAGWGGVGDPQVAARIRMDLQVLLVAGAAEILDRAIFSMYVREVADAA